MNDTGVEAAPHSAYAGLMQDNETVKADFQAIWDWCSAFAKKALAEHGELYPFGAHVSTDGTFQAVAVDCGEVAPQSATVIDMTIRAARQEAEKDAIRAFGLCYDATVTLPGQTERSDAIICRLEHRDREPIAVVLPYRRDGDIITCDTLRAAETKAEVFTDEPPA